MMALVESNGPDTSELQPNKRRRKKSIVWEHFTVEDVGDGCTRACCNQCKQTFAYSTGTKLSGTSHLKRHIGMGTCLASRRKEKNQLKSSASRNNGNGSVTNPPRRQYNGSLSVNIRFDQERCRHFLAKMIIMHEYPLHMVEHTGFISFLQRLQPQFRMVNFDTVQGDCLAIYQKEKQEVFELLSSLPGRISLTLDLRTSTESLGFVFLTCHFITSGWKRNSWLLKVVMVPYPESQNALYDAVKLCISEWGLEKNKLFSLTLNKSIFKSDIGRLREYLSFDNPLTGWLLIEQCYAQVLTSLVQEAIRELQEPVSKLRESIKHVQKSQANEERFLQLKQKLQIDSTKTLFLDDRNQWNTTLLMLESALSLKEVFLCLDTIDPDYQLTLTMKDWLEIETLCTYLKLLFDAAKIVSTREKSPTADLFYHEVWKIQLELVNGGKSNDPLTFKITNLLREIFDPYWRDCSLALAVAVVLDPQFKMTLIECSYTRIFKDEADQCIKIVQEAISELYLEYVNQLLSMTCIEPTNTIKTEEQFDEDCGNLPGEVYFDPSVFISELSNSHQTKTELDQYLEEPLVTYSTDFDILSWWDLNSFKYPILSKMARDVLSITMSTVSPEKVFCVGDREIDSYWSSIHPETVEALKCAKDWLQCSSVSKLEVAVL